MNKRPDFSFIGVKPCGCVIAAMVDYLLDEPEHGRDIADELARWKKAGLKIERVSSEYVRAHFVADCPHEPRQERLL